ncbi:GNAT family N-acetyltransferase [Agromyces aurantiacus]|uniref:GNAT family N-acetyltransferase n=1 Tax=Agromyces aurantiacus TaxID=165814 RepID=A0ABV9R4Y9_9MICO|nr:GNAT family N-acetyltransferase [Agromyces aurantiacus]MBM7503086.1 ribosomal protein S18 acetylase RimI-like enzyme [Agromyces aurantiacus]
MTRHPLDRPAWAALAGGQRRFAVGGDLALRFDPLVGPFAAADRDDADSAQALSALAREHGWIALLQVGPAPAPPGTVERLRGPGVQMVLDRLVPVAAPEGVEIVELGEADASAMLELATLTEPGPFAARTFELGGFVGVRDADGTLIAMAGERMRPPGFAELSGVCTRPEHRGRGLAASLSTAVAQRILDRGEQPFLHVYARNAGAIAVYRRLGFVHRADVEYVALDAA